ncbi:MAG: nuclear transport factor 2 family protein [Spirochaetes bacterium]|nr:nuclear transport factor 2 family protein [Spirochaetota bacterium]
MPDCTPRIPAHALIDSQLEAYNGHNLDEFCAYYHNEAIVCLHPSGEILASGQAGLRQRYTQSFAIPGLRVEIANRILLGNLVIDEELIYTDESAGQPRRAVLIYEVIDGKISRAWICRDS